jgi:hypothetical protein
MTVSNHFDDHRPERAMRQARLASLHHTPDEVGEKSRQIYDIVLARSQHIRDGNFTALGVADLRLLFTLYDDAFFDGLLQPMLCEDGAHVVAFRLSSRLTRAAGQTVRVPKLRRTEGGLSKCDQYEIAISTVLLFATFRDVGRPVMVGGLVCRDRLEALQRVFEHELIHLAEFLAWGVSRCAGTNYQQLSQRIFAHEGVKHDLVTPREMAAATYQIRLGDHVSFEYEGKRQNGRVNRITRRATILVEDESGETYSDGKRYKTFYVPLSLLQRQNAQSTTVSL